MDIFAHTLWTNVVFYKKLRIERLNRFIALLFGVAGDFICFAPIFIYRFFVDVDFFDLIGKDIWVVKYASESYKYTHSVVVFGVVVLLVYIVRKIVRRPAFYWPMWGWGLHILIDIPTHRGFYETPFLFPLSGYQFSHGISWSNPVFMVINYSVLALIYLYWFMVLRKKDIINTS